jgi:chromosome segregation ATPase
MAPELVIAAVSASCAVLLTVGGVVVGRAFGDMANRTRNAKSQATITSLQQSLQEALTKADAARAEVEALRVDTDEKVSQALGAELAKSEKSEEAFDTLTSRLEETEARLKKAQAAADEADKEFTIVREKLDKTEKRLAEANRRVAELESAAGDTKASSLEEELAEAKRALIKLEVVEKERDHALRRIRELDAELRKHEELPKATSSAASEELEKLRGEVTAANERVAVSERVMEGVRARSNMLSQELKKVKAELAALKG